MPTHRSIRATPSVSTLAIGLISLVAHAQTSSSPESPSPAPTAPPALTDSTSALTPEQALEMLRKGSIADELVPRLKEVLSQAATKEPSRVDWQIGLAWWNLRTGNYSAAREIARNATVLAPDSSQAWTARGTIIFLGINDAPTLDKMGLADEGKEAYLQAVKLNGEEIEARQGLAQFYINAPGIAGGSLKKAREQGNALLKIKNCEFKGRLVLAMVEAEDDEYENAAREFELARKIAVDVDEQLAAVSAHANMLLTKKEDYKATIAFVTPLVESFGSDGWRLLYFRGQAYRELKNWSAAQADFESVLAMKPDARNTRFGLGEVLRKQRKYPEAAAAFREFARRFPDDERARKAIEEADDCEGRK